MLVVVCVKQVPDTTLVKIDPVTGSMIREGVPIIMNPYDTHALEAGLRLKEQHGCRVVAVSMGPPNTEITLRKALAMGVDEAILLSDRAFGGADTLATSKVLAETIQRLNGREEVGVVLCGQQTIDGDTAQVGPGIATRLGYSPLTLVARIDALDPAARKVTVRRKLEGYYEVVEAKLPVLITVVREINQPRYPTVPGRLMAEDAPIVLWDNKVLGLERETIGLAGSATQVRRVFSPEKTEGEMLDDGSRSPEEVAGILLDKLITKDILHL